MKTHKPTRRELHVSSLNDTLQQMPVRGARGTDQWLYDMAAISTWLHLQKLSDLRGLVDLNGEDAEGVSRLYLIGILIRGKGF